MRRMSYAIIVTTFVVLAVTLPQRAAADSMTESVVSSNSVDLTPTLADVREWTVERMLFWSRPGRSLHPPAQETFEDGMIRYGAIADAARDVSYDPSEKPIFGGRYGRARTMALLLAVSLFESGYRKDVDLNVGKLARGDGGRSWCLMQIQLGKPILIDEDGKRMFDARAPGVRESTPTRVVFTENGGVRFTHEQTVGIGGPDLIADRRTCFRVGLRAMRRSFRACRKLPRAERLSAYASGNCDNGREASRKRVGTAVRWINTTRPPLLDSEVQALLKKMNPKTDPSPEGPPNIVAFR